MSDNDIIEMARRAGVDMSLGEHWSFFIEELEAFAKLVAAKEREACAKICDEWAVGWPHPSTVIAESIRKRGEA